MCELKEDVRVFVEKRDVCGTIDQVNNTYGEYRVKYDKPSGPHNATFGWWKECDLVTVEQYINIAVDLSRQNLEGEMRFEKGDRVVINPGRVRGMIKFVDPCDKYSSYLVVYDEQIGNETCQWCGDDELVHEGSVAVDDDAHNESQCKEERERTKPITAEEAGKLGTEGNRANVERIIGMINADIETAMASGQFEDGDPVRLSFGTRNALELSNGSVKNAIRRKFESAGWLALCIGNDGWELVR